MVLIIGEMSGSMKNPGYALIPAAVTLVLAVLLWLLLPVSVSLDVGSMIDNPYLVNFHEREQWSNDPEGSYRWSRRQSEMVLVPVATPAVLAMRLAGAGAGTDVHLKVNTGMSADFTALPDMPRVYKLLWKAPVYASGIIHLQIQANTDYHSEFNREIGVLVDTLSLQPYGTSPPPVRPLLVLALMATLIWMLLRGIGMSDSRATIGATGAGFLLILSWHFARLSLTPFLDRLLILCILICLFVALVRFLVPPQHVQGQLLVSRLDMGIYLGLAWWIMPLFQIVIALDSGTDRFPAIITQILGGATLVLVLLALVFRRWEKTWPLAARTGITSKTLVLTGLLLTSLLSSAYYFWYAYQRGAPDFGIQFWSTQDFVKGLPLYNLDSIEENHFGYVFKWPPFIAILLRPFVLFDRDTVMIGYRIVNTLFLLTAMVLLLRQADSWPIMAALVLLVRFQPAADSISYGQIDAILLYGFVIAWLAAQRGKDDLAGGIIAILSLLKVYPVLLFGLFLMQRRWRALRGAVIAGLIYMLIAVVTIGWDVHRIYLFEVLPRISGGTAWIENQTLNGFMSRLFALHIASEKFEHPWVTLVTYTFFAVTLGIALFLSRSVKQVRTQTGIGRVSSLLPLQFSLFIVLMIMAVPTAWIHYHTITIFVFAMFIRFADDHIPLVRVIMLAAAYALLSYGNQWSFFNDDVMSRLSILGYSYKFYGLLLLYTVTAHSLWMLRRSVRVTSAGLTTSSYGMVPEPGW